MSEKQFPPSIQRLRKARKDGNVVKSRILVVASGLLGLLGVFLATRSWVRIGTLIQWFKFKVLGPGETFELALLIAAAVLVLAIGTCALTTVLSTLLQTQWLFATKQIIPDLKRIQPLGYVNRLRESAIDAAMGLLRVGILLIVLAPMIVAYVTNAVVLFQAPTEWVIPGIDAYLGSMIVWGVGVMVVLGGIAYGCARWRYFRQHRMSIEEVKEEYKESEGDPHFRAARRHQHQALAMSEIEKRVKNSKVLVIRRRPVTASS